MASEPIETVTVTTTIRSLGEPTNSPEPPTLSPVPSLTPTTLATSVRQTSSTADPTALPADTDGQGSPASGPPMGAIAGIITVRAESSSGWLNPQSEKGAGDRIPRACSLGASE
ncbi:hypothetical protein MCOR14_006947 [Pyricularia oryzae]|nr:hypothetical protein MCOR16_006850 [Pyricularia oryzae]KAI6632979.1 hypothetical protein MCOR14_006947 [Pyricularia oryzae]KAI6637052.1 hypothetical protein MCOR08_003323 [Pyricularia oryzae]